MRKQSTYVFLTAFLLRLLATPASLLLLNPYSTTDAVGFAENANQYASLIQQGIRPPVKITHIYTVWGAELAPFWLLPGPSTVYALTFIAFLGAVSVYNIYVIAAAYGGRSAGLWASIPVMVLPSYVLIHSSLLREAVVLFGLTTAVRALLAPGPRLRRHSGTRLLIAVLSIAYASHVRLDNIPVYLLGLAAGFALYAASRRDRVRELTATAGVSALVAGVGGIPYIQKGVRYLGGVRANRAYGRTVYLPEIVTSSIPDAIAFSWVGVLYFLFSPFPWMVHQLSDSVVFLETVVNIVYAAAAVKGVKLFSSRHLAGGVGLGVAFIVGVVLYGYGTANVGTAVRHRQMFLWVLFIFGGVYLSQRVTVKA